MVVDKVWGGLHIQVQVMNSLVQRLLKHCSSRKYNLASYIKIEEGQFFFDLDEQALRKIHQARIMNYPLYVPCCLRILLLRLALLHIGVIRPNRRKKANTYLLPGLTFYTCYTDHQEDQKLEHTYSTPNTARKKKLLRSLISPDGDILHQIRSDSLQHPYFLEISAAHHWLTTQLLNHLHTNLNWIPRSIGVTLAVVSFLSWLQGTPNSVIINFVECVGGYFGWWQGTLSSAIIKFVEFVEYFVAFFLLRKLWIWVQPLVIRWSLARILSCLEK